MRKVLAGVFAGVLCFLPSHSGRAQLLTIEEMQTDLYVQVSMDTSGDATLSAWSRNGAGEITQLLPQVLNCREGVRPETLGVNAIRCSRGLRSDGLALEAVLDLAPIAKALDGSTGFQLHVNYPRLGFESSSLAMTEEGNAFRVNRTARFEAGTVPAPIRIRFGYRPNQLAGIYLPLLALALALMLVATIMSRAGYAHLALSATLLGTMIWMAASAQLNADAPVRILLFGTPLATVAALFVNLWPPLFCIAMGTALGSRLRPGRPGSRKFAEIFSAYAIIPLVLTSAVGILPHMSNGEWFAAAGWLSVAPIYLLARRAWNRIRARSGTRQLTAGELKERASVLAARAGCPQTKVYISFSASSQVANAFALPGRMIFLTAPLVRLLSKREVDAVVAHEFSHARHSNRGGWTALCMAFVFCASPAREIVNLFPGGLAVAMILPVGVFFTALHGSRKREFAADGSAAALTGDPRAMISSLARIARNNHTPLHMSAMAEWFASHPSTSKRIAALAAAARLQPAELEALCASNDPDEHYEIPMVDGRQDLFTPAWQRTNAGIYGWNMLFGSCGAGLLVAWLFEKQSGSGMLPVLGGIALGCALTKGATAAAMYRSYGRLRRKLAARLGIRGQIVGLAPDSEARLYNGYRFPDAGLLRFENGRLCYQSERIAIALNPAAVVEVGMVAAAPSNWFRRQPMVRFRNPESGQTHAVILHTLDLLPAQRRLLRSIERWRATESSPEDTSIKGLNPTGGEAFHSPTLAQAARGFLVTGGIALTAAIATCGIFRFAGQYVCWALVVTACAYASMLLPSMLYRPPMLPPELPSPAESN